MAKKKTSVSSEAIGKRLKIHRITKGLSIKKVADKCKISNTAMYSYEAGTRRPKDNVKETLAKIYGTTVQSLFYDKEEN